MLSAGTLARLKVVVRPDGLRSVFYLEAQSFVHRYQNAARHSDTSN